MRSAALRRISLVLALAVAIPPVSTTVFAATAKKRKRTARKVPRKKGAISRPRPELAAEITRSVRDSDVHIENPSALAPLFERLSQKRPVSILHYGDSHTAADIWTGEMRRLLQAEFGNGGAGFSHAGRPWNSYRREDLRSGASKRWYTDGLAGRSGDGLYGLAGVSIESTRAGEWVTLQADGPVLQIWYLQRPDGGSFELSDAGQPIDTVSTAGERGPGYYTRDVDPGPHDYKLRTTDASPVRLFGWVTGEREGLTYEMLGINGAQASMVLSWNAQLMADHIRQRDPALIILAYGTNEASNRNLTEGGYRDLLIEVIGRFRSAAPKAAILLVGPPDREVRQRRKWTPFTPLDRIVAAERAAAAQTGCGFYDLRAKMGGAGVMNRWVVAGLAQNDHIHLTGPGYRVIAQALYSDLLAAGQLAE